MLATDVASPPGPGRYAAGVGADHRQALVWIVLTMGDRPRELERALDSIAESGSDALVVSNGGGAEAAPAGASVLELPENLGIPGGRHAGAQACHAAYLGFLDDDAQLAGNCSELVRTAFDDDPELGAVALHITDENGATLRRHVPRLGSRGADHSREVATFLGGACAIRAAAYESVGGYFEELWYGHEELELSWRLIEAGWRIRYLADAVVTHPHMPISRHAEGWRLTGRNRVAIARRTLPWPIAFAHVTVWLGLGLLRAPDRATRRAYLRGWRSGWSLAVDRNPVRWRTVWRLTRLGRPPVL